jgi:hypothetical protein
MLNLTLNILPETFFIIPFSVIGGFSQVATPYWMHVENPKRCSSYRRLPKCFSKSSVRVFGVKIAEFAAMNRGSWDFRKSMYFHHRKQNSFLRDKIKKIL